MDRHKLTLTISIIAVVVSIITVVVSITVGALNYELASRSLRVSEETGAANYELANRALRVSEETSQNQLRELERAGPILTARGSLWVHSAEGAWKQLDREKNVTREDDEEGDIFLVVDITNVGRYPGTIERMLIQTSNTGLIVVDAQCLEGQEVQPCQEPIKAPPWRPPKSMSA